MNLISEKILLLLHTGMVFSYAYHPGKKWKALTDLPYEWGRINQREIEKGIRNLRRLDILERIEVGDNMYEIRLTEKGKVRALNRQLENIKNKSQKWDGKWRMVAFDIPNKFKKGRDVLRRKLNKIGFCKLQESIFVTPYDCKKEIEMLVKFFRLEKYVRFGILYYIDNEMHFKNIFKLN